MKTVFLKTPCYHTNYCHREMNYRNSAFGLKINSDYKLVKEFFCLVESELAFQVTSSNLLDSVTFVNAWQNALTISETE